MIPICLVTGFLGSGKTSLLREIVSRHCDEKIVFLVNEFSALDVDGTLLDAIEDDVVSVPGGSIFCKCLVTQFISELRAIPERFGAADGPVTGLVIEATGVADPGVIEEMLGETRLDEVYELASIVSVCDPGSLPKLVHTLPSIRAQIEAADTVLINKIDLFAPDEVEETERLVREINPSAAILRTIRCGVDLSLFAGARVRGLEGEYALCADPSFRRLAISFAKPVDVDALAEELRAAGDEIYRAKGFVPTLDGLAYLDLSAAGLTIEPAPDGSEHPGLVIIARGYDYTKSALLAREYGSGARH